MAQIQRERAKKTRMNYIKMYLISELNTKQLNNIQPLQYIIKINFYNEVVIYTLNTLGDLLTVKIGLEQQMMKLWALVLCKLCACIILKHSCCCCCVCYLPYSRSTADACMRSTPKLPQKLNLWLFQSFLLRMKVAAVLQLLEMLMQCKRTQFTFF